MIKTPAAQRVVEVVLADSETGSEGAEDDVSEYEDNVETNSDSNREFEDEVCSEPPPEGTAQPTAGGATQPTMMGGDAQHTSSVCPRRTRLNGYQSWW